MQQIVDSHVHFWDRARFDYAWLDSESEALRGSFLPSDLLADNGDIAGLVVVQADCRDDQALAEATWFHELSAQGAPIRGVVAQAPLERECLDHLTALAELPLVSGVRRLLQGERAGFSLTDQFVSSVRQLAAFSFSFDLCIRREQLAEATELVRRCPEVRFVLDHLAKPEPFASAFDEWARELDELAAEPNVWCKLSGLASEAPPERRSSWALQPWLVHALDAFGPERCMYGSDWPVVTAVSTYPDWRQIVESALEGSADEYAAVFGATAHQFYSPRLALR